jgi:hypothetical protein
MNYHHVVLMRPDANRGVGGAEAGSIDEFFRIVEIVKTNVVAIRDAIKVMYEMIHAFVLSATEAEEESKFVARGLNQL